MTVKFHRVALAAVLCLSMILGLSGTAVAKAPSVGGGARTPEQVYQEYVQEHGGEVSSPSVANPSGGPGVMPGSPSSGSGSGNAVQISNSFGGSTGPAVTLDAESLRQRAESAGFSIGDGNVQADTVLGIVPFAYYELRNHDNILLVDGTTTHANNYLFCPQGFSKLRMDHSGVGRYYYRVYTDKNGWSAWCNSKESTPGNTDGALVTALQIRVKGYTHTYNDIYYKAMLSDGTVLDWAKNGQTCGTMGTGKYIVALRVVLWNKNTQFPGGTSRTMDCNYEGVVYSPGAGYTYSTHDGRAYTGWGFVDNTQYYFIDGRPASGWHYVDGYKYYLNADGSVPEDLEPVMGLPGAYQVRYNKSTRTMYIMAWDADTASFCIPYKVFMSSCGPDTPLGAYKTYVKYDWHYMHDAEDGRPIYCQKLTRFYDHFLIHSLLYYNAPDPHTFDAINYNYIDDAASGGCIRLTAGDANWFYTNVPLGTEVVIYADLYQKGPIEKPAVTQCIPRDQTYDPTDPAVAH